MTAVADTPFTALPDAPRRATARFMAGHPARVWGLKEKLFERAVPLLADHQLAHWLEAAHVCDGLVKGLRHPGWPADAWDGLRRLVLMMLEPLRALPAAARSRAPRLALGTQ